MDLTRWYATMTTYAFIVLIIVGGFCGGVAYRWMVRSITNKIKNDIYDSILSFYRKTATDKISLIDVVGIVRGAK